MFIAVLTAVFLRRPSYHLRVRVVFNCVNKDIDWGTWLIFVKAQLIQSAPVL
jgi:hypothetical protein